MTNSETLASDRAAFQQALHAWYRAHARRLPWREAPTLYQTVVSEFMLQQTQVATVLPYFDRWMRALPDFGALAATPAARVLKLWEGLGYYSRARNLHRLAQAVVALPAPPRTPAEWRELPGVGPYTAAAITSISFGEPAACVDGNVVRILARLTGEGRRFRDGSAAAKFFAPLADALIKSDAVAETNRSGVERVDPNALVSRAAKFSALRSTRSTTSQNENRDQLRRHVPAPSTDCDPGLHNQAMMELGATVCLRQNPRCPVCPVASFCTAQRSGEPGKYPRLKPKQIEQRKVARAWCEHRGRLLLRCGQAKARRLAGLHELPEMADLGLEPAKSSLVVTKRRTITRFQITESIHRVRPTTALLKRISSCPALGWTPLDGLDKLTLSGPHKRWIRELSEL